MSQTLLSQRLKELERVGIVERRGDNPRRHEWHLTKAGRALAPVILAGGALHTASTTVDHRSRRIGKSGFLSASVASNSLLSKPNPVAVWERRIFETS